ncbi:hypothetical protein IscW_ISCW007460 [Ixodes scapularis]|uniref:Uncharacterized protein n=1 Tax=Ixodes scapularis TaxID=6945 RepID=B7PWH1_IXOSC|nr:hypothetical protein IscW_ISCW007460 [Ixodes scapularis]|eukprot:XP_002409857.1 hypothetical protein IscW_ISCW007460 [Ixodes scapularis]
MGARGLSLIINPRRNQSGLPAASLFHGAYISVVRRTLSNSRYLCTSARIGVQSRRAARGLCARAPRSVPIMRPTSVPAASVLLGLALCAMLLGDAQAHHLKHKIKLKKLAKLAIVAKVLKPKIIPLPLPIPIPIKSVPFPVLCSVSS